MSEPRLEDHFHIFHEGCGGIVLGPMSDLKCAECGRSMLGFVGKAEMDVLEAAEKWFEALDITESVERYVSEVRAAEVALVEALSRLREGRGSNAG